MTIKDALGNEVQITAVRLDVRYQDGGTLDCLPLVTLDADPGELYREIYYTIGDELKKPGEADHLRGH